MDLDESEKAWIRFARNMKKSSAKEYIGIILFFTIIFSIMFSFLPLALSGSDFMYTYTFSVSEFFSILFFCVVFFLVSSIIFYSRIKSCFNIIAHANHEGYKVHNIRNCILLDEGGPYYIMTVEAPQEGVKGPITLPLGWRKVLHKMNYTDPEKKSAYRAFAKIAEISGSGKVIRYGLTSDTGTSTDAHVDMPSHYAITDTRYVLLEYGGLSVREQSAAGVKMAAPVSYLSIFLLLAGILSFVMGAIICPFINLEGFNQPYRAVVSLLFVTYGVFVFYNFKNKLKPESQYYTALAQYYRV